MVPKPVKMMAVDSHQVLVSVWLRGSQRKWKVRKRSCSNINSGDGDHFKANLLRAAHILKKEFDADPDVWEEPGDPQEGQVGDSAA